MNEKWDSLINRKIGQSKERGGKKRGWVVLRKSILTSSINYRMTLDERGVFVWLIVMADEIGPVPGLISDNDFRDMPHEYLAQVAHCPLEIFEATLQKGIEDDSIYENSHGIFLTHFDDYQFTEYDRQKPWREKQKEQQRQLRDLSPEAVEGRNRENDERIALHQSMKGK